MQTFALPTSTDLKLLCRRIISQCMLEKSAAKLGYSITKTQAECELAIQDAKNEFAERPEKAIRDLQDIYSQNNGYLRMFFARKAVQLSDEPGLIPSRVFPEFRRYLDLTNGFESSESKDAPVEILGQCFDLLNLMRSYNVPILRD